MEIFGWGKKNTADVNAKGELKTYSEVFSTDYDAALDGDAYTMDIDGITAGADGLTLAVLANSHSSKVMVVTTIRLTPNASSDDQELEVYIGGTFEYLAEGVAVTPTNMLGSKSGGATGGVSESFYVADGTANTLTTITGGLIAFRRSMITKGKTDVITKGSGFHIPPGYCMQLLVAKSDKFRGSISFYYK